jgi:hypothetical protein
MRQPGLSRTTSSVLVATLLGGAASLIAAACTQPEPKQTPPTVTARPLPDASTAAPPQAVADIKDAGPVDAPYDGPVIAALFPETPIMSDMDWPTPLAKRKPGEKDKAVRIGYIRQGGRAPVIPEAHPKENCPDGWYELLAGGFVCGKYATLDLNHPRVKQAPHLPSLDQPLPYEYGYNSSNGTPLYKSIPSAADRMKYEPWLRPKRAQEEATPTEDVVAVTLSAAAPASGVGEGLGAIDPWDSGVPWYLRTYDGGKPTDITLDDLREDPTGPVAKRMVKGFYLALDKEVDSGRRSAKWWRTTSRLLAPFDRIYVPKPPTDFHGVWLGKDPPAEDVSAAPLPPDAGAGLTQRPTHKLELPLGFVLWYHAHKYTLNDDKTKAIAGAPIPRFSMAHLTGQTAKVGGQSYDETDEGWWMRTSEATKAVAATPPADLKPGEKWVDVNLSTETLVAFEGDKPVYATLVSTGKMDDNDKEKDHRTHSGEFRIREKHIAATMDGDVASDGPYSIEDVPWIMYFNGSVALHGAFWHGNFGHVQSHGCVNLAPLDAKAVFGWTEPQLPQGWHGVFATPDRPGTRVVVHDPPTKRPTWAPGDWKP